MVPKDDFFSTWERVKYVTGWSQLIDLSRYLDVSAGTVSKAKKRGEFPGDWAAQIAISFNSNTDWLLFGRGDAKYPDQDNGIDWHKYLTRAERGYLKSSPQQCSPAFGEALKRLRVKFGLDLAAAAKIGGIKVEDYLAFERGYRPAPSYLISYAKHFKVNVEDLFNGVITDIDPSYVH